MNHLAANMKKAIRLQRLLLAKTTSRSIPWDEACSKLMKDNTHLERGAAELLLSRGSSPDPQSPGSVFFNRDLMLRGESLTRMTVEQVSGLLEKLQRPMLLIGAEGGLRLHQAVVDRELDIMRKVTSLETHVVPGSHHVHMNQPELVADLVWDFLEQE